jgi:hypothetical protein
MLHTAQSLLSSYPSATASVVMWYAKQMHFTAHVITVTWREPCVPIVREAGQQLARLLSEGWIK